MEIVAADIADPETLADAWRALEDRSDASFFQGWSWVGCLAQERFVDPLLVTAGQSGVTVGMALFSRPRARGVSRRLLLHESGDVAHDSIYVEHNGAMLARGQSALLLPQMARAARAHARARDRGLWRLVASRVDAAAYLGALAMNLPLPSAEARPSWTIDLERLRRQGGDPFTLFGANTRAAIRRSLQSYAKAGGVTVSRAETLEEAHGFLDELIALHQTFRVGRGQAGAFAEPFMRRFHQALIARALPNDEVDLLRVATPAATLGLVYNFRHKGRVCSYQSGFAVEGAGPREKPGLTAYALCIARYLEAGLDSYDFLVGDAPYKRNITNTYGVMY